MQGSKRVRVLGNGDSNTQSIHNRLVLMPIVAHTLKHGVQRFSDHEVPQMSETWSIHVAVWGTPSLPVVILMVVFCFPEGGCSGDTGGNPIALVSQCLDQSLGNDSLIVVEVENL